MRKNEKDSSTIVTDLESYASYIVHLDASFESVAWYIRNKTIRVFIDPNQFKEIDVPISIAGEVTGMVYLRDNTGLLKPQDRIIVGIYTVKDTTLAGQTTTEMDGSFDFSGLPPGNYLAHINPAQMRKLNMGSSPETLPFTILANKNGDVVEGLKF